MGIKAAIVSIFEGKLNKKYEQELNKQHLEYTPWIELKEAELMEKMKEIPEREVSEFYLLPTNSGSFAPFATKIMSHYFDTFPECNLVYADEDVMDEVTGTRRQPIFKPDWSPDTYLNQDYLGNPIAIRTSFLQEIGLFPNELKSKSRQEVLKVCLMACNAFDKQGKHPTIGHISQVLFHATSEQATVSETNLIELEQQVEQSEELISIIVLSKDNPELVYDCFQSIEETKEECACELILVDNGSCEETRRKIEEMRTNFDFTYLYHPMEFNFSALCNYGATQANGSILLFLNDDIKAEHKGWLFDMLQKAKIDRVGAVGIKLCYPKRNQIQHGGIVNLAMGPVHKLQFLDENDTVYLNKNRGNHNVIAVTGACLMIEQHKFDAVGGFDEQLEVAFNDVDLCFRLHEQGYYNVVLNEPKLLHYESFSRGNDESVQKAKRLQRELKLLYTKHPHLYGKDPYYSKHLNHKSLDTRILPGNYESIVTHHCVQLQVLETCPKYHRMDECVTLRIEQLKFPVIHGYGVVLGSNNARFTRWLILKRVGSSIKDSYGYILEVPPYYRNDLEEGMPEQVNVALSGFSVKIMDEMKEGEYEIGLLVKDKINHQKLINYSSRRLVIEHSKQE